MDQVPQGWLYPLAPPQQYRIDVVVQKRISDGGSRQFRVQKVVRTLDDGEYRHLYGQVDGTGDVDDDANPNYIRPVHDEYLTMEHSMRGRRQNEVTFNGVDVASFERDLVRLVTNSEETRWYGITRNEEEDGSWKRNQDGVEEKTYSFEATARGNLGQIYVIYAKNPSAFVALVICLAAICAKMMYQPV